MTTAQQLMSDKEFCARRVQEQDDYMYDLHVRLHDNKIDYNRYVELAESAMHQRGKFSSLLETGVILCGKWSKGMRRYILDEPGRV